MRDRSTILKEIGKYTKDEILTAIDKSFYRFDSMLQELPMIRYNKMCDEASKIHQKACSELEKNNIKEYTKLSRQSENLWKSAQRVFENRDSFLHVRE